MVSFFEVPSLASDALITLHPLLEKVNSNKVSPPTFNMALIVALQS